MSKNKKFPKQEGPDRDLFQVAVRLDALVDPLSRIIDRSAETILDVGCGQGYPIRLIRTFMRPKKIVGVDLFEEYVKEARNAKLHDEYVISDVRKINFPPKSFDVVIASHVIEHLPKGDGLKFLKTLEKIAKKQVIIATPIGEMDHPAVDGNVLQLHLSHYYPEDFEKLGYKVVKYGRKSVLGDHGFVHKVKSRRAKQLVFLMNIALSPLFYLFPQISDYVFVAYKNIEAK